jgi:aspartyl aminopeptidase
MIIGDEEISSGMRVVGAHIDSPRLELKGKPLFSANEFALFQTNYHGGIKRYQWTNIPLALVGIIDKKDGTRVEVNVGLAPDDPILMIPDMSPHVDRGYNDKKVGELVTYESLDPIVAHLPPIEDGLDIEDQVLIILKSRYGVSRADLVSAELSLVPAFEPRDMGLDRSMVAAYGQDDKLGAYAALRAVLASKRPAQTALAYLVDNEEVGNVNNTGAKSDYFSNLVARLLSAKLGKSYRDIEVRKALRNSKMISIDVNPGVNPMRESAWELNNAPKLGYGVNFKMYGSGFTANSEFTADIRRIFDNADIPWQTATYKVGRSGGGTIGGEFSRQDMEVIDFGVPVLSIHTPYAVSSKIDIYNLYRGSKAFFED